MFKGRKAYPALAEGGPVGGNQHLTVEELARGGWPAEWVWTSGPDRRHLYRLKKVWWLTSRGVPVYTFVKDLEPGEQA